MKEDPDRVEPSNGGNEHAGMNTARDTPANGSGMSSDAGSGPSPGGSMSIVLTEAVLEALPVPVIVDRSDGTIALWNASAERAFGWSASEVTAKPLPHIPQAERPYYLEIRNKVVRRGLPQYIQRFLCQTKQNQVVKSAAVLTQMSGDGFGPSEVVAVFFDVEKPEGPKAPAMEHERLMSLGQLAGGIAHELNGLLASVPMVTRVLRAEVKTDSGRALLDTTEFNIQRAITVIKQMLAFGGVLEQKRTPVDVNAFAVDLVRLLKETLPPAIMVRFEPGREPQFVLMDMSQLQNALMSLCMNIRDAVRSAGTVTLRVTSVQLDAASARTVSWGRPGRYVCLSVISAGIGGAGELGARAFEPAFVINHLRNQRIGMELAAISGIVSAHGGFVRVESGQGEDVQIDVYLPAAEAQAPSLQPRSAQHEKAKSHVILVIEDEPSVRSVVSKVLQESGYEVLTAANGLEGVEMFAERFGEIDLVLTDLVMPELDGAGAVRRIRAMDPHARVIVATGDFSRLSRPEWRNLAIQGTLSKPFTPETLLAVVQSVLQRVPYYVGGVTDGEDGWHWPTFVSA